MVVVVVVECVVLPTKGAIRQIPLVKVINTDLHCEVATVVSRFCAFYPSLCIVVVQMECAIAYESDWAASIGMRCRQGQ